MRHIRFVFLLLVSGCLLGACRAARPPSTGAADVVTSADGQAQLTIPAGALPQGVKLSDVHITRLTPNAPATGQDANAPFAFYQLEPDGLQLSQPITVALDMPGQPQAMPLVWLISQGTVEILPNVRVDMGLAGNKTVMSVQVSHFSKIAAANGFFQVLMDNPGTKTVGNVFGVLVSIFHATGKGHVLTDADGNMNIVMSVAKLRVNGTPEGPPSAMYISTNSDQFAVVQGAFTADKGIISPGLIIDAPARQGPSGLFGAVSVVGHFQCVTATAPGAATITHNAYIEFNQTVYKFVPPAGSPPNYQPPAHTLTFVQSASHTVSLLYNIATHVICVNGTPTPTITPSETPTAVPPNTPTNTPTSTPTPTPGPPGLPIIKSFVAVFNPDEKATHYTVKASDPAGGRLKYEWTKVQPPGQDCGLFGPTNQAAVVWQHADKPDGPCPKVVVHPANIIVVVSNATGYVTCEYHKGSASGNVAECINSK